MVEFLNAGKKVDCGQYANLRKVALLNDVPVEGLENLSPKNRRELLNLNGQPKNRRLSCQCKVMGDVVCVTAAALD